MQITQDIKNKLIGLNQCYMVGILAENEQYYSSIGIEQKCVTEMRNSYGGVIMFYVSPLSCPPQTIVDTVDKIIDTKHYIGLDADQSDACKPKGYRWASSTESKIEMMQERLSKKLIIFKPKIEIKNDKVYKNLIMVAIETDVQVDETVEFTPVPLINMTNDAFEKKLKMGQDITLDDYNHSMYPPEYIICGDYIYFNFPEWSKHRTNSKVWFCEKLGERTKRVKIELSKLGDNNKMVSATENLLFIDKIELFNIEKSPNIELISKEIIYAPIKEDNEQNNLEILEIDDSEAKFIDLFQKYTLSLELCYSKEDLVNLHTCIKTNPLTILAGMSGTGKSELADCYAKIVGASEQAGTYLFVPINPSYTEPGDILGYLNNTTGLYTASETGLVDFLIHANDNPNMLHFVIFDEMNLSQVEYWFAPFISLLERKENERRLGLYNSGAHCINKKMYPDTINIGDNVKFLGTVNLDETTKDFSDRLLDRANVINLKKESLATLKDMLNIPKERLDESKNKMKEIGEKYKSWIKNGIWTNIYTEEEVIFIDALHELLIKYDSQKGVSFRISKKIAEYIDNIPTENGNIKMIDRRKAFDIQIKQRLITKLKGTERQYGKLIGKVKDAETEEVVNSELLEFLQSDLALSVSDFESCKLEILRKAKDMVLCQENGHYKRRFSS